MVRSGATGSLPASAILSPIPYKTLADKPPVAPGTRRESRIDSPNRDRQGAEIVEVRSLTVAVRINR